MLLLQSEALHLVVGDWGHIAHEPQNRREENKVGNQILAPPLGYAKLLGVGGACWGSRVGGDCHAVIGGAGSQRRSHNW